jgi:hypothetical protein
MEIMESDRVPGSLLFENSRPKLGGLRLPGALQ